MKLILVGKFASGKSTLAKIIVDGRTEYMIATSDQLKVHIPEGVILADNVRLTKQWISELEQTENNVIVTTIFPVPPTTIPVFRLYQLDHMIPEAQLLGVAANAQV